MTRRVALVWLWFAFVGAFGFAAPRGAWAQDPELAATKVVFGGVQCCDDTGRPLPYHYSLPPDPGYESSYPAAVVKAGFMDATITISNASPTVGFYGDIDLNFVNYGVLFQTLGFTPITPQRVSIPPGGSVTVSTTLGPFPNRVGSCMLMMDLMATLCTPQGNRTNQAWGVAPKTQDVYLLFAGPQAPQAQPWLGVLHDACYWANWQTTADGVAQSLTLGLFYSQRFAYPGDGKSYWADGNVFKLTKFLQESNWVSGNCVDVSDYLLICANAVGLDFAVGQYQDANGTGEFTTNPICLIGSDPASNANYTSSTWSFHQFDFTASAPNDEVYDACGAQLWDLTGGGYRNPPFKWDLSGYWQITTPSGFHLGLVLSPSSASPLLNVRYVPGVE